MKVFPQEWFTNQAQKLRRREWRRPRDIPPWRTPGFRAKSSKYNVTQRSRLLWHGGELGHQFDSMFSIIIYTESTASPTKLAVLIFFVNSRQRQAEQHALLFRQVTPYRGVACIWGRFQGTPTYATPYHDGRTLSRTTPKGVTNSVDVALVRKRHGLPCSARLA